MVNKNLFDDDDRQYQRTRNACQTLALIESVDQGFKTLCAHKRYQNIQIVGFQLKVKQKRRNGYDIVMKSNECKFFLSSIDRISRKYHIHRHIKNQDHYLLALRNWYQPSSPWQFSYLVILFQFHFHNYSSYIICVTLIHLIVVQCLFSVRLERSHRMICGDDALFLVFFFYFYPIKVQIDSPHIGYCWCACAFLILISNGFETMSDYVRESTHFGHNCL